jgi:hypothetical protein
MQIKTIIFEKGNYTDPATGDLYIQRKRYDVAMVKNLKLTEELKYIKRAYHCLRQVCRALGIKEEVSYRCPEVKKM